MIIRWKRERKGGRYQMNGSGSHVQMRSVMTDGDSRVTIVDRREIQTVVGTVRMGIIVCQGGRSQERDDRIVRE
jgi:hypothetical protein